MLQYTVILITLSNLILLCSHPHLCTHLHLHLQTHTYPHPTHLHSFSNTWGWHEVWQRQGDRGEVSEGWEKDLHVREGSVSKWKRKKEKTNKLIDVSHLAFLSGDAAHADSRRGGPPSVCKQEGVPMYLWGKGAISREKEIKKWRQIRCSARGFEKRGGPYLHL